MRALDQDLLDVRGAAGAADHAGKGIAVEFSFTGQIAERSLQIGYELIDGYINDVAGRNDRSTAPATGRCDDDRTGLRDQCFR